MIKLILVALTTVSILISFDSMAEWKKADGFQYNYECGDINGSKAVVFVLHGSGTNRLSSNSSSLLSDGDIQTLFNKFLSDCILIVTPESGEFTHNGVIYKAWEYTKLYDRGSEMNRVISLIVYAKLALKKDVYLIGGSAGGNMAYGVMTELYRMRLVNLLSGLILFEAVSPYSVSLTGNAPNAYAGVESTHIKGDVYYPADYKNNYLQLGLTSENSRLSIPILLLYSINDPYVDDDLKIDFANKLFDVSHDINIVSSGSGHVIDGGGWTIAHDWLFNLINK